MKDITEINPILITNNQTKGRYMKLNEETRNKLIDSLFYSKLEGTYDRDGIRDLIMEGGSEVGLSNYTDEELVEEYEIYSCDPDEDELLAEAKTQLAIKEVLAG